MRLHLLALAAALVVGEVFAAEVPLSSVSSASGAAQTYVATAGASLAIQCPGFVVRYKPGNSGVPPVADGTSAIIDFTESSRPFTVQLAPTEDRLSFISAVTGKFYKCFIFTQSAPAVTTITNLASSQCLLYYQTVVSVGTGAGGVIVPTASQTKRLGVEVCISGENAGLPKLKCLVDGTPVMGVANPGDLLVIGGKVCQFYPVDSSHPIKCIADTAGTATLTTECVPP